MKKGRLPILAVIAFAGILSGQTLDEVLAKYYEAGGGLAKMKSLAGWKMTGKIAMVAQGLEMPIAMWQQLPNKMRVETIFQGRTIVQACDGRQAWWIVPFISAAAQEMPLEEGRQFCGQADGENPLVVFREKGHELKLLGQELVAGAPAFTLRLTRAGGDEVLFYIDAASGIELKASRIMKQGGKEELAEVVYGDYRMVDGRQMPFAIENRIDGRARVRLTLTAIEINPLLNDDFFAMPALADKQNP